MVLIWTTQPKYIVSEQIPIKFYCIFGSLSEQFLSRIGLKDSAGYSISSKENVVLFDPRNKNLGIRVVAFSADQPKYLKNIPSTNNEEWDSNRPARMQTLRVFLFF